MSANAEERIKESMAAVAESLPADKKHLLMKLGAAIKKSLSNPTVTSHERFPDFTFGPNANPEVIAYTYDHWTPAKEDVIVASFPKTGTTWTREIVRQLLYKDNQDHYKISRSCEMPPLGYLESVSEIKFDIYKCFPMDRHLWGTHLYAETLNMETILASGAKMIYVMRNPKDMFVSLKNFISRIPWMQNPEIKKYVPEDFDEFVRSNIEGKSPLSAKLDCWYPHHIKSYYKYNSHPNLMFLIYEDMKENPNREIAKIAKFINVQLTEEELNKVVANTTFDNMKTTASGAAKMVNMFRKGGVGDWKNHYSDELSAYVDAKFSEAMADVNINFRYTL